MKKKILIVEDEVLISETIRFYLEEYNFEVSDFAVSYDEAVDAIENGEKPDLILLDIRLYGEKSGIEFAKYLKSTSYEIPYVFLTSQFDKRSFEQALDTQPAGYLIKPIQEKSLIATIELVFSKMDNEGINDRRVKIKEGKKNHFVSINDIISIESDHIYCKVNLRNQSTIYARDTLLNMVNIITPSPLVQCHRSFLINTDHVIRQEGNYIILSDNVKVPMSKSYKQGVFEKLS